MVQRLLVRLPVPAAPLQPEVLDHRHWVPVQLQAGEPGELLLRRAALLLQVGEHGRVLLHQLDGRQRPRRQHGGQGGGEAVAWERENKTWSEELFVVPKCRNRTQASQRLVLHDVCCSDAETPDGPDGRLQTAHDEVDVPHGDSLELGDAAAVLADGAEGDGLVDEEAQLVLPFELDHAVDVAERALVHVDALHDEETAAHLR